MAEASEDAEAKAEGSAKKKGGKGKLLILILAPLLLLGGGGTGAYFFVPAVHDKVAGLLGKKPADAASKDGKDELADASGPGGKPFFVEIPELTVTMPNSGRLRQLRIKIALELAKNPGADGGKEKDKGAPGTDLLTPRIYDGLVLYLRTLHDTEVDGTLSMDRMRGDLQRRLDLLLGDGVLKDVLITSLIIG